MSNSTKSASYYDYLFIEIADPRTINMLFMQDPLYLSLILGAYLYIVTNLGPKLMKNRKPWKLTKTLIVYNLFQVLISTYVFVEALNKHWLHYNWICQPCDYSNTPETLAGVKLVHMYFIVKLIELLDTLFFVLRKKQKQITFLHVYHHTIMAIICWSVAKYVPGGHGTFPGLINSFVHIIMYGYYLLAALGPQYQKYLWWKKYITTLQLVQFLVTFIHGCQPLFVDCGYPKWTLFLILPNCIVFYYMFTDFYNMAYGNKKNTKELNQENSKAKLNNKSNVTKMKTK